jgi:hypothetical protein
MQGSGLAPFASRNSQAPRLRVMDPVVSVGFESSPLGVRSPELVALVSSKVHEGVCA